MHFEKVQMTLDEAQQSLMGQWNISFACDGSPITHSLAKRLGLLDGYNQSLAVITFYADSTVSRHLFAGEVEQNSQVNKKWVFAKRSLLNVESRGEERACRYTVSENKNSVFDFKIQYDCFLSNELSIYRVHETGEAVLMMKTPHERCEDGSPLQTILTAAPMS